MRQGGGTGETGDRNEEGEGPRNRPIRSLNRRVASKQIELINLVGLHRQEA